MTETRALWLVGAGTVLLALVGLLSLLALGVRGEPLIFGVIAPAVLGADGIARVVTHYGEVRRRERR